MLTENSDLGIGELDFKFSFGYDQKVAVKMNLSNSNKLYHGYSQQLPAYMQAEDAKYGIFIIVELNKEQESQVV